MSERIYTSVTIRNLTRKPLPNIPFEKIAQHILGKKYMLSFVCVGETRSRALNKKHRGKDTPTNVLAFPLSKKYGEIFITRSYVTKQAPSFGLSEKGMMGFLFIHACLHLTGLDHSNAMEKREHALLKKFSLS